MAKDNTGNRGIRVDGLDDMLSSLRGLGKEASSALRQKSRDVADKEAVKLKQAGTSNDAQSGLVAREIRTKVDRVPTILAGGSKKLAPSRKIHRSTTALTKSGKGKLVKPAAGDVFFGAEYGGGNKHSRSGKKPGSTAQFRPHRGKQGYWLWPQFKKDKPFMVEEFEQALDEVRMIWGDERAGH